MPYPALCTGCERFVYEDEDSGPCPNCFPGLTRKQRDEALVAMSSIMDDFFAFQAAACTTQADCPCGRHHRADA